MGTLCTFPPYHRLGQTHWSSITLNHGHTASIAFISGPKVTLYFAIKTIGVTVWNKIKTGGVGTSKILSVAHNTVFSTLFQYKVQSLKMVGRKNVVRDVNAPKTPAELRSTMRGLSLSMGRSLRAYTETIGLGGGLSGGGEGGWEGKWQTGWGVQGGGGGLPPRSFSCTHWYLGRKKFGYSITK